MHSQQAPNNRCHASVSGRLHLAKTGGGSTYPQVQHTPFSPMHLFAIKSTADTMPSVTAILFKRFFELCEIVESTCNCNLVRIIYK